MRDLLIIAIVIAGSIAAFRRPWIGVLLWNWLSIMNPHRYTYGIAYEAPLAAVAAVSTLIGALASPERESPFKGAAAYWLAAFMVWMTLSWAFGVDPADDYQQWNKVMKVDLMILVGLAVMRTKQHIFGLAWVAVGSLALLGAKGGLFTLATGGNYRVWGPPGSFIADNNEFALALVMTIPLLRFLQLQIESRWQKRLLTLAMLLCAASALGSQSRGALVAISAMVLMLWWRGKSRVLGGITICVAAVMLLAFMPDSWNERMSTIEAYEEDASAMGRINAWWNAWNLAFHYPLGVGFNPARGELFAKYAPFPEDVHAAHSIYFQVLGNHGFIGLFIFLMIGVSSWLTARWLRIHAAKIPEAKWASDLGSMAQVSMVGYAVGGAFLSLSYFDLPYVTMTLVLLARRWVLARGWEHEPAYAPGWRTLPGLAPASGSAR